MTCPKCRSSKIEITSEDSSIPMYKCQNCGYKNRLFPGFESDKKTFDESEE